MRCEGREITRLRWGVSAAGSQVPWLLRDLVGPGWSWYEREEERQRAKAGQEEGQEEEGREERRGRRPANRPEVSWFNRGALTWLCASRPGPTAMPGRVLRWKATSHSVAPTHCCWAPAESALALPCNLLAAGPL